MVIEHVGIGYDRFHGVYARAGAGYDRLDAYMLGRALVMIAWLHICSDGCWL